MTAQYQQLDLRRAPLIQVQTAPAPDGRRWYASWHVTSPGLRQRVARGYSARRGCACSRGVPGTSRNQHRTELMWRRRWRTRGAAMLRTSSAASWRYRRAHGTFWAHGCARRWGRDPAASRRAGSQPWERLAQTSPALGRHGGNPVPCSLGTGDLEGQRTGRHRVWNRTVRTASRKCGCAAGSGMFINTLPLRLNLDGLTAQGLIEHTQRELVELLSDQQASLAEAQRCSAVGDDSAAFYRAVELSASCWESSPADGPTGLRLLASHGRTNYPILLSVDDRG